MWEETANSNHTLKRSKTFRALTAWTQFHHEGIIFSYSSQDGNTVSTSALPVYPSLLQIYF